MRTSVFLYLISAIICISFSFCSQKAKKIRIGLSQCTIADDWRKNMCEEMQREIGFYPDHKIELIIRDAHNSSTKQIADINELYRSGIDLLIVSPNQADELTPVIDSLFDKKIPIIVIDRRINSEKYTAFIGGNNFQIGETVGQYAKQRTTNNASILEIKGLNGSTPAKDRSKGFYLSFCKGRTDYTLKKINADWLASLAEQKTDSILKTGYIPDFIYAHNDPMAAGARKACKKNKVKTIIYGVDGLPSKGGGVDMVLDSTLDATFLYPTGGDKAIQIAMQILQHERFNTNTTLNTFPIDRNNASSLKIQYQLLVDQQKKIDKQRDRIGLMMQLISNQKLFLFIAAAVILLMIGFIAMISFLLKRMKKANNLIVKQKEHISNQMDELQLFSQRLKTQNLELNQRNEEIIAQNEEITKQKNQITKQNDHILSGIRCAQTMQNSLINNFKDLANSFECFELYKPKDIVSGDFYWYKQLVINNQSAHLLVLADCTGHGVAGAMITMLGIKIISQIVEVNNVYAPAEILNQLEENVQRMYHQQDVNGILGMDMVVCLIEKTKNEGDEYCSVTFSGAKNPLYICKEGTLHKIAGSKKSIGVQHKSQGNKTFESNTINLPSGAYLYITTDGFIDQNNPERVRFGSSRFEKLLTEAAMLPLNEQKAFMDTSLLEFQQEEEQRDDISVLGIRL